MDVLKPLKIHKPDDTITSGERLRMNLVLMLPHPYLQIIRDACIQSMESIGQNIDVVAVFAHKRESVMQSRTKCGDAAPKPQLIHLSSTSSACHSERSEEPPYFARSPTPRPSTPELSLTLSTPSAHNKIYF